MLYSFHNSDEGGLGMEKYNECNCENCGRSSLVVEIEHITIQQHIANLCLACSHVLTLPKNKARFLQLVRKKESKNSNKEMQKAHQLLSMLLFVGACLIVVVAAATSVTEGFDFTVLSSTGTSTTEYLSFVELMKL